MSRSSLLAFSKSTCLRGQVSRLISSWFERVLKALHVYSVAREFDSFQFQARPLFSRGCPAQLYLTTGAQYTMPWQLIGRVSTEQPSDRAMQTGVASRCRDSAVGADPAAWDREDYSAKGEIPWFVGLR